MHSRSLHLVKAHLLNCGVKTHAKFMGVSQKDGLRKQHWLSQKILYMFSFIFTFMLTFLPFWKDAEFLTDFHQSCFSGIIPYQDISLCRACARCLAACMRSLFSALSHSIVGAEWKPKAGSSCMYEGATIRGFQSPMVWLWLPRDVRVKLSI